MNPELFVAYSAIAMIYSENPKERLNGIILFLATMKYIDAQMRRIEQMSATLGFLIQALEQQEEPF